MTPAVEVRSFQPTIPANTPVASPFTLAMSFPPRAVDRIIVRVPPGPRGEVGFAIGSSGVAVLPLTPGTWIVADDDTIDWQLTDQIESGSWTFFGYNLGQFDHTLYVQFLLTLFGQAAAASAAPVPVSAIYSPAGYTGVIAGSGLVAGTGSPLPVVPVTPPPPTIAFPPIVASPGPVGAPTPSPAPLPTPPAPVSVPVPVAPMPPAPITAPPAIGVPPAAGATIGSWQRADTLEVKTDDQLRSELSGAGYRGPYDEGSLVTAYQNASKTTLLAANPPYQPVWQRSDKAETLTLTDLNQQLHIANYPGPWAVNDMLAAYDRASSQTLTLIQGTVTPPVALGGIGFNPLPAPPTRQLPPPPSVPLPPAPPVNAPPSGGNVSQWRRADNGEVLTYADLQSQLQGAGYGGPWDVGSMVAAYQRASGTTLIPVGDSGPPPSAPPPSGTSTQWRRADNGQILSYNDLYSQLQSAGYGGPWDVNDMVAAYQRASGTTLTAVGASSGTSWRRADNGEVLTVADLQSQLQRAGYNGPWDAADMVAAYQRASGTTLIPL